MDMGELLEQVKGLITKQADATKLSIEEIRTKGAVPSETREKIEAMAKDCERLTNVYNEAKAAQDGEKERVAKLEAWKADIDKGWSKKEEEKASSIGQKFIASDQFKEAQVARSGVSRKLEIGSFWPEEKAAGDLVTTNTTSLTQPQRIAGIQSIPNVPLTVRTLLPTGRTSNNMIEFVKENTFTNNAGPQWSPTSPVGSPPGYIDGALKPKSTLSWTLVQRPVSTIGHYMKASRQILDDAPMLQSEINNRLLYGLALEEEEQLLLGDGNNGNQLGLIPQAAVYNASMNVAGDTKIDKLRHALLQVTLSKYLPTAIVLAPKDWHDIELVKTEEGGANKGNYILSNPVAQTVPRIWGYRVVESLTMPAGTFLVGNFATGAQIFDRMNATVEIARQNEDDFVRNMVSILAEERLAFAVYTPAAFVEGLF